MTFAGLQRVVREVEPLARRFSVAGHRLYLVGGVVRDLYLDRDVGGGDVDLTTDARPEETKAVVAPVAEQLWTQGERFGTIGCTVDGRSYEITTHRAEAYDPSSRKPEVVYGSDVEVDLSRRDFTVNAMAWEVPDGSLVDPFGGIDDLDAGVLRTPLDPLESFGDDPLRMVRAARFAAAYGLTPTTAVIQAMSVLAERLDIVATERIREELEDKLLVVPAAAVGLALLADAGLLERVIPELADPAQVLRAIDRVAALRPASRLRLAALLADLGPADLRARLSALRCSNADRRAIARLVAASRTVAEGPPADTTAGTSSDAAVRVLASEVAAAGVDPEDVFELAGTLTDSGAVRAWRARWRDLAAVEDLSDLDGPLDGTEVTELLGVEPGPVIGRALAEQRRLRLERGPLDAGEARRLLVRWWETRGKRS